MTLRRERLRALLDDVQWPALGVVALVALGLGIVGFHRHFEATGEPHPPTRLLYLSLQLFTLESGSISPPVNWQLDVARFLAPAVAVYAAVRALLALFRERLQLLRLRRRRGHVVVCGLGRKGDLFAQAFQPLHPVAVIEQDAENDRIGRCRELGIPVVVGDATSPAVLRKAHVGAARYLIAVCGEDSTNAEIAARAREVLTERRNGSTLTAFVHVVGTQLCDLLTERLVASRGDHRFRLEFFNVFERAARAWLEEHPPVAATSAPPHLLVLGVGELGKALVVGAVREWLARGGPAGGRLRVTIVDRVAASRRELLQLEYPRLAEICDLAAVELEIPSPEFQRGDFLFDAEGRCDVTTVYVCLDDDARSLSTGLALLGRLRRYRVPIVVRTARGGGVPDLLGLDALTAFGVLDRTCRPELLLGGTRTEILARAIHADYVRRQSELGETVETNPSLAAWDELPETLKESNRRQADHIGVKLGALQCEIEPLADWSAPRLELSAAEVELLAQMEHERWVVERVLDGWSYAPGAKDLARKTSPYLAPWPELTEEVKEQDRATARRLPGLLGDAGFRVYRPGADGARGD